jgi:hypothetical protein
MNALRYVLGGVLLCSCSTKIAQTTYQIPPVIAPAPSQPPMCGSTLKERLTVTSVQVDADIRYKLAGINDFPLDERIAYSAQPNGMAKLAWLDNGFANVHVTPLTVQGTRLAPDTVIEGIDLGGIVALDDGFTVLTRRDDPGDPINDDPSEGPIAKAAFLVRYQNGAELFGVPLTGTKNITDDQGNRRNDCSTVLNGRLVYNGSKYGAYFIVHGCRGSFAEGAYGDKLVYADDHGRYVRGGFPWGCSHDLSLRLVPEADAFTSMCFSDRYPDTGLNLVIAGEQPRRIAPEYTNPGYSAGKFGSVLKLGDDRYFLGWLSRGVLLDRMGDVNGPAFGPHDIAFSHLAKDRTPIGRNEWLMTTPDIDEQNLHFAPYGPDRILMVWDDNEKAQCMNGTCQGPYGGTHVRLIDSEGKFLTPDEMIEAPPNSSEDITRFPNGDLGWAFAAEQRDYSKPLDMVNGVPNVPPVRQINVARLTYCAN